MATMFPRREFTSDDLNRTLLELELVPSASVVLLPVSERPSDVIVHLQIVFAFDLKHPDTASQLFSESAVVQCEAVSQSRLLIGLQLHYISNIFY